ncbi:hypothetical protein PN456_12125 [Nodularia spumigena CS-586/05]|nr:hypothetical protein [Nodularia spumigena]MDB9323563.1 hypothetical protein [Nodularia spumigena CS-591/07A]MDB9332638.1 hypothetical protein [Nodularia spumigena CS-591/04]MDB9360776.1 hypothetical protein [Nodularia spumigena CS-588/02]MDB9367080.1 hypothetical protein [Nodularia spumigena CS-588/02A10]MDB9345292.1 hypothetical protein [Nodularia spumigena CS-588/06]
MERLYRGFDIITNPVHTSNQQRRKGYANIIRYYTNKVCLCGLTENKGF